MIMLMLFALLLSLQQPLSAECFALFPSFNDGSSFHRRRPATTTIPPSSKAFVRGPPPPLRRSLVVSLSPSSSLAASIFSRSSRLFQMNLEDEEDDDDDNPPMLDDSLTAPRRRCCWEIPLLDLTRRPSSSPAENEAPCPRSHLPAQWNDCLGRYIMEFNVPLHKQVIQHACDHPVTITTTSTSTDSQQTLPLMGHVVYQPSPDSLIGSIGCTTVIHDKEPINVTSSSSSSSPPSSSSTTIQVDKRAGVHVLLEGYHRFIVVQVKQSIPYPIVIVEELFDTDDGPGLDNTYKEPHRIPSHDDGDDDDDLIINDEELSKLDGDDLMVQLWQVTSDYLQQQLQQCVEQQQSMTLLEQSILFQQQSALDIDQHSILNMRQQRLEVATVLWQDVQYSLPEYFPTLRNRYYALALLVVELTELKNPVRHNCLQMTNGLQRMRYVLREVQNKLKLEQARVMAQSITDITDDQQKELQVGEPTLPPWSKQIRKGTEVEYYWNEEYGWCYGQVVEDPIFIVNELIVTVYFPSDGTTHRLPFTADEKVRWRPPLLDRN